MKEEMIDLKKAKKEFGEGAGSLAALGRNVCEELEIARRMVEDLADVPYEECLNYQRRLDHQRQEEKEGS